MRISLMIRIDFEVPGTVSETQLEDAAINAAADAEISLADTFRWSAPEASVVSIQRANEGGGQ